MRSAVVMLTGIVFVLLVSGCAANDGQGLIKVSPTVGKMSSTLNGKPILYENIVRSDNKTSRDYIIGPEDVLEVSVWKNTDLSKTVIVRPDGKISLPLIGDVKASGMTPSELKDAIARKLTEYKEDPIVSVIVHEINSYSIFVMGEVVRPGQFRLKSNTTFLQALSLAGGFTPFASRNKIMLIRKDPRTLAVTEMRVRYDTILSGEDPQRDIVLQPGDTIVVP